MSLRYLGDRAPLLRGLSDEAFEFLESLAEEVEYASGSVIFNEDDPADTFYLIADGRVGLEIVLPNRPVELVETLGYGDLLGVSWILPPYQWNLRARALGDTKLESLDAAAVRKRCDTDVDLALHVYRAVATEAVRRLHATRVRLVDPYAGRYR